MKRRPRINRKMNAVRRMVQDVNLGAERLVQPIFLIDGQKKKVAIPSLPGQYRLTLDLVLEEIASSTQLGIYSFIMFPVVEDHLKDKSATYSYDRSSFYLEAARKIKMEYPEVCLISDIAMDPYSSDGHDGLVEGGKILNDETLPILGRMAIAQAEAGFDYLGPSDMMDGRVGYLRDCLEAEGYQEVGILAYTAKYASAFYGPFRDALDSAPKSGDKKTYQMNTANRRSAAIEAELDIQEGADIIMVKPALNYLDVIADLRANYNVPIAAYHVSGEYAMLKAASEKGWLDYDAAMYESLLSIRRAGADMIITYCAKDYARLIVS